MRVGNRTVARAFGAALLMAMVSGTASAAPLVFAGQDNLNLSGGGVHPNTDAAQAAFIAAAIAAGGVGVQDFDGLSLGAAPASFAVGSITA